MHPNHFSAPQQSRLWDVFCRVVDNFGDMGVCWRLAVNLAERGHRVRLWTDDASALHWMAPGAVDGRWPGIQVLDWAQSTVPQTLSGLALADVWVETFGCDMAPEFVAAGVRCVAANQELVSTRPVWINLEYLTAEGFAERSHTLPSPVMTGPAAGWTKYFFYPGFTRSTGGLLRERNLLSQQASFDQAAWLTQQGIPWKGERLVSLFCYEPAHLGALLTQLRDEPTPTRLLVTHGRAGQAVKNLVKADTSAAFSACGNLTISYLPQLTQPDFDHLLWACDLNFVRGEDSLVRALWSGKPLVWQAYPQHDNAHHDKLNAFLDMLRASPSLRRFHQGWNGTGNGSGDTLLPLHDLGAWQVIVQNTRARLLQMDDLVTQLDCFVSEKR